MDFELSHDRQRPRQDANKRRQRSPLTLRRWRLETLYHEMKMQNKDKFKTEKLTSEILRMADFAKVHAADGSTGQELEKEAKKIEEAGDDNSAIIAFHDYAAHWKGLRDIYFPEKQKEWNQNVKHVHQLCEDVMVERGIIKPSLLRKLLSLLKSQQQ